MAEEPRYHCISSAVVAVLPGRMAEVAAAIELLGGPEIHAREKGRIIVVMEGSSAGELGSLLTTIGNLDGVIAANMVFEHIEEVGSTEP
jgi:periplasmic nitrate reductase NapD